jgi:non-ribosomal peptide synthetase component F/aryl carrier-like protein
MSADRAVPLSAAQRRMWALAQVRPGDPFFSLPFIVKISGPLDVGAFNRAIGLLVDRHPALRTVIEQAGDDLLQVVVPASGPRAAPTMVDLSGLAETARAARAEAITVEFVATPFDLVGSPLLRMQLLRLSTTAHQLLVNVHHAVFDGVSAQLFVSELTSVYAALRQGLPEPVAAPATDQRVFMRRRDALDAQRADESLEHWVTFLAGAPEVLALPTNGPRPRRTGHPAARRSRLVPARITTSLRSVARRQRATMFMIGLAACDVLLRHYGDTDIVVGIALSGRDTTESADVLGYLARVVVTRADLSDDPTFTEHLRRVRREVITAHDFPNLPMEAVLGALGASRDPSSPPLYQATFDYRPAEPVRRAGPTTFVCSEPRLPTMKDELGIGLVEREDIGLVAEIDYRADLFDAGTIDAMLDRLLTVLDRVGLDPDLRVSRLMLASEAERRLVVDEWNRARPGDDRLDRTGSGAAAGHDGRAACSEDLADLSVGLHQIVERQARARPEAIVVDSGAAQWTYRDLDAASARIGAYLRTAGVGPGTAVGVCLERSFELVATTLAVLRIGAVCVPADPAAPSYQVRDVLDETGVEIVCADERSQWLFDPATARIVRVPATIEAGAADRSGQLDVPLPAGADDAAFVLRAPGASEDGEAVGVVLEHRALMASARWATRALPSGALAAVALDGPLTSAAVVAGMFAAFAAGGRLLLDPDSGQPPTRNDGTNAPATARWLAPAQVAALGGAGTGGRPAPPLAVVASGPAFAPSVWRTLPDRLPAVEIHRVHGGAETAGFGLGIRARAAEPISIGRPAGGTVAYVLDPELRAVPPGVVGELYVAGPGLARCYVDRPDLTAARFLPDPFSDSPGGRMFATGDLVRHVADGRLIFMGRADGSVTEGTNVVEAELAAHPEVVAACVVRLDDGTPAAAVVTRPGAALTPARLRAHLLDRLPSGLAPARIALVEALPSAHGEPDRRRIAADLARAWPWNGDDAAEEALSANSGDAAARATRAAERSVADAWTAVLGDRVGLDDNFFEAGGDSISLVRLRDRLREGLGRDVDLVDLFRRPTVRAQAAFLGDPPAADPTTTDPTTTDPTTTDVTTTDVTTATNTTGRDGTGMPDTGGPVETAATRISDRARAREDALANLARSRGRARGTR